MSSESAAGEAGGEAVDPETVRDRLRSVVDPCSAAIGTDLDVVELGLVETVAVDDGAVTVSMRLTSPGCMMVEYFAREVDAVVGAIDGVESVALETDAGFDWHRGLMEPSAREKREARRRELRDSYGDELDRDVAVAGDPSGAVERSRVVGATGASGAADGSIQGTEDGD